MQNFMAIDAPPIGNNGNPFNVWRYVGRPMTRVLVGADQVEFNVHIDLACEHSEFFMAVLRGEKWKETIENLVNLPEAQPKSFEVFAGWIYHQNGVPLTEEASNTGDTDKTKFDLSWLLCVYELADCLIARRFKAHIVKAIKECLYLSKRQDLHIPLVHAVQHLEKGSRKEINELQTMFAQALTRLLRHAPHANPPTQNEWDFTPRSREERRFQRMLQQREHQVRIADQAEAQAWRDWADGIYQTLAQGGSLSGKVFAQLSICRCICQDQEREQSRVRNLYSGPEHKCCKDA